MKKRNIYKDIVWMFILCAFVSVVIGWGKNYIKEHKAYGLSIQADRDLTADMLEEFRKLSGILSFEPTDTAAVTIRLGTYTMETELVGLDLEEYPLNWKQIPGVPEIEANKEEKVRAAISMGNTPILFFGTKTFFSFADAGGYPPLKSQVEKWMDQYQTLELTITDESGWERNAKISGILSWPEDKICMDKAQMKEVFGSFSHTTGGFLKIYGYKNTEKACGLLESAGFAIYRSNIPFSAHISASSFGQSED